MASAAIIAARYAARAARAQYAASQAIKQAGDEALKVGKRVMEEKIYAHPIPTTKSGKPRWQRTRNLINHEKVEYDFPNLTATLVNEVEYAEPRHELGKPGRRKTEWPAHWRDEALAEVRGKFPDYVAQQIRSVLEKP